MTKCPTCGCPLAAGSTFCSDRCRIHQPNLVGRDWDRLTAEGRRCLVESLSNGRLVAGGTRRLKTDREVYDFILTEVGCAK